MFPCGGAYSSRYFDDILVEKVWIMTKGDEDNEKRYHDVNDMPND